MFSLCEQCGYRLCKALAYFQTKENKRYLRNFGPLDSLKFWVPLDDRYWYSPSWSILHSRFVLVKKTIEKMTDPQVDVRPSTEDRRSPSEVTPIAGQPWRSEDGVVRSQGLDVRWSLICGVWWGSKLFKYELHLWKLTWHWKIPMFHRKYIFKWWIFHCHVNLGGYSEIFTIWWFLGWLGGCLLYAGMLLSLLLKLERITRERERRSR